MWRVIAFLLAYPVSVPSADRPAFANPVADGLTRNDVVLRALKTAPAVRRAAVEYERSAGEADSAPWVFLPRIDLNASYVRLSRVNLPPFEVEGFESENPFPQVLDNYRLRATASIPLSDYFLTRVHTYSTAQAAEVMAKYQYRAERARLSLVALTAFFDHVRAQAAQEVAQSAVTTLAAQLTTTEQLMEAGLTTRVDVLQVRARLAETKMQAQRATAAQTLTRASLLTLIGEAGKKTFGAGEDLFRSDAEIATPAPDSVKGVALKNRPELEATEALLRFRSHGYSENWGGQWPKLSVRGNFERSQPNQRVFPLVEEFNNTWDVSAVLEWSPNDFVAARTLTRRANAEVRKAEADLEELHRNLDREVAEAVGSYRTARESIAAAGEGLEAAAGQFEATQQLFEAGETTTREVLDSEAAHRQAQLSWIDAHLSLRASEARLAFVQGRLIEEPSGRLMLP